MRKLICFFLIISAAMLGGPVFAEEVNVDTEVNSYNQYGYSYKNEGNTNVGSVGNIPAGNVPPGGPEIPLQSPMYLQKKNLNPNQMVFRYLPEKITRETVKNYIAGIDQEIGPRFFDDMVRSIESRPYVYQRFSPSYEIAPIPGIPESAKEGVDYVKVAVWQFSATNEVPNKQDFALLLSKRGMDLGADVIIPIGEGAEFIFRDNATSLGMFSAFAQVFTTLWGYNASPNISYYKGKNRVEALPHMEVVYLHVLDQQRFWAAVTNQFEPKVIVEKKPEISGERSIPPKTKEDWRDWVTDIK